AEHFAEPVRTCQSGLHALVSGCHPSGRGETRVRHSPVSGKHSATCGELGPWATRTSRTIWSSTTQFSARFRLLREREGQGNETSGLLPTPGSRSGARACTYRRLFPLPVSDNDAMKALQRSFA